MSRPNYDFAGATFFFFKAFARRPMGVLWIALLQIALYTALTIWAFAMFWPVMQIVFDAAMQGAEPDEAAILEAVGAGFVQIPLLLFLSLVAVVMVQGAWLRLMTRDEIAAGLPFRFGFDELRLIGVNLCFIVLIWIGQALAFVLIAGVGAAGVGAAAASDNTVAVALGGGLVTFIAVMALIIAAIVLALRFAAAPALSIAQKRFRLFGAFAASKDVWGWMLLSYIVLIFIWIAGAVAVSIVQQIVAFAMIGSAMGEFAALGQMSDPAPEQVFEVLRAIAASPGFMAGAVVSLILWLAFQITFDGLWHGVGAYAAVRHTGGEAVQPEALSAPAGSVGDAPREG